jgi:hypothetical protein
LGRVMMVARAYLVGVLGAKRLPHIERASLAEVVGEDIHPACGGRACW